METEKINRGSENPLDPRKRSTKKLTNILILLAGLLVVLVIVIGWLLYDRKQEAIKLEEVTNEKIQLIGEFEDLSREYEDLRTDNDSLNAQLEARQEEIEDLIDELYRTRVSSAATINEYRNELGTLRDVLKSYIVQVDSLNQANIQLRQENLQARQQVAKVETELKQEREVKEDLSARVELGSRLMAEDVAASAINQRGREISRTRRAEQIQVCFTLKRNAIAAPGMREVYIRIKRPDQLVLASSTENIMMVDEEPLVFTASREINYENIDIDACIYYTDDGSIIPGTYSVEVYTEGYLIGSAEFSLR